MVGVEDMGDGPAQLFCLVQYRLGYSRVNHSHEAAIGLTQQIDVVVC